MGPPAKVTCNGAATGAHYHAWTSTAAFETAFTTGDTEQVALVSSTWKRSGIGPDGSSVDPGGNTTEVIRRQADGTWRYAIDDPFSIV